MPSRMPRYLCLPALLAALVLAGCGSKSDGEAKPVPSIDTTLGAPTSSPSAEAPPTSKPAPKPPSPTPAPAAFPSTAKAYAEAVVAAWKAKNLSRLAELTTPQVHEQLIEIPGPPNMAWAFIKCDGAAGSTYCQFSNADAHVLTLRMSNAKLGAAQATTEVKYQA